MYCPTLSKKSTVLLSFALAVSLFCVTGCSQFNWQEIGAGESYDGWQCLGGQGHGDWVTAADVSLKDDGKKFEIEPGQGIMVNGASGRTCDLITLEQFGDCRLKLDFMVTRGSNSGVYLMGKYEIQILDSYGRADVTSHDCGGVYERWIDGKGYDGVAPRVNASRPAGQWQSYDITFKAPRFDDTGKKTANARFVKVIHNGTVIQEDVELKGPTRGAMGGREVPIGPLRLQGDHGPVAYRNIRIQPLD